MVNATQYDIKRDPWRAVPSSSAALLGISIPYQPPRDPLAAFIWRKRMLVETTMGLMLLEPWEKILMMTIMFILLSLFVTGVVTLVPQSIVLIEKRSAYYLFGHEPSVTAGDSVTRLISGWVAGNATREL